MKKILKLGLLQRFLRVCRDKKYCLNVTSKLSFWCKIITKFYTSTALSTPRTPLAYLSVRRAQPTALSDSLPFPLIPLFHLSLDCHPLSVSMLNKTTDFRSWRPQFRSSMLLNHFHQDAQSRKTTVLPLYSCWSTRRWKHGSLQSEERISFHLADGDEQIVVPNGQHTRLLHLSHDSKTSWHPGVQKLYYFMRRPFYWPSMSVDCYATVRNYVTVVRNRFNLRRHDKRMNIFSTLTPLEFVVIDILETLLKVPRSNMYLAIISF